MNIARPPDPQHRRLRRTLPAPFFRAWRVDSTGVVQIIACGSRRAQEAA